MGGILPLTTNVVNLFVPGRIRHVGNQEKTSSQHGDTFDVNPTRVEEGREEFAIGDRRKNLANGADRDSIALCSDIGPLPFRSSGVSVSGILNPPALCLKANIAGVVQLH